VQKKQSMQSVVRKETHAFSSSKLYLCNNSDSG
jgi:hypothetical protein